MVKIYAVGLVALVSACAATPPRPLTQQETLQGVAQRHVIQTCVDRGQLPITRDTAAYLGGVQSKLARQGNREQINAAVAQVTAMPVTPQHCRQAALLIMQGANEQAQHDATQQANTAALQKFSNDMQNMQQSIAQQRPRTVMCQHQQWGNMTTCNSY